MESTLPLYQHVPFDDEMAIRLLHLQPGEFEDDIKLHLQVVSLGALPAYCALSYVWGECPHDTPVYCDDKTLLVSGSCVAALRRLRSTTEETVLWIDAICINQNSLEERGHQVRFMCDVYSQTQRTWIWLGESTDETDFVMDFINDYHKVLKSWEDLHEEPGDELLLLEIEKLKDGSLAEERRRHGTESDAFVALLCARSWFDRVWTVQEYALSRDPQVICGSKSLPMPFLWEAVSSLAMIRARNGEPTYTPISRQFFIFSTQYDDIRNSIHANDKMPIQLSSLLASGRFLKASDPKDVVFGLHGILEKFQITIPRPDYTKPIEIIYMEATKAAIEHDNSLTVLLHCSCSSSETPAPLPSWVPDWASNPHSGLQSVSERAMHFKASGSSRASFHFFCDDTKCTELRVDQRILSVKAITVDILEYWSSEFYSEEAVTQKPGWGSLSDKERHFLRNCAIHETVEAWMTTACKLSPYPTGETMLQAWSRTLMLDLHREASMPQMYPELNLAEGFSHWLFSHRLGSPHSHEYVDENSQILGKNFREDFLKEIGQEAAEITDENKSAYVQRSLDRSNDAAFFEDFAEASFSGNRFFTTRDGYMGLGTLDIEAGDEVLLVAGVSWPLIARRIGERYRLIGRAYVHGIMDGEKWPADESKLVDILFE